MKTISRGGSSDSNFCYLEKSEAAGLIRHIGCICTVMKADCIFSMRQRIAVVQGYDEERAATIGCICYQDNEKPTLLFSLDTISLDMARMIADISER